MQEVPVVSVIIPTYNRPHLTLEAFESVVAQSYDDIEVIIVDDGSPAASREFLRQAIDDVVRNGETRKRIHRLYCIEHCGMPGAVRNAGVDAAQGRYVAFLDSDDLWMPNKIEAQLAGFVRNSAYRWSHTYERWIRDGREVSQRKRRHAWSGDLFADALVKCIIGPSTVMMERSLFLQTGGFRADLEVAEDYEYWLRLTACHPTGCIAEKLTIKRAGHPDQLSGKHGYIEPFRIRGLLDLYRRGFFPESRREEARVELCRKLRIHIHGARKRGREDAALEYEQILIDLMHGS